MFAKAKRQAAADQGFTLIELLVVILIIGILAAVAIPSFLAQKGKASDASAKELVRTARTTAETYSTDHGGTYENLSPKALNEYEKTLQIEAGKGNAYISKAEVNAGENNEGYTVTATATDGHTFTIVRKNTGEVERTCTPTKTTGSAGGGCQNGTW